MRLYCGQYLLPIARPPLADGALLVRDGRILEVGTRRALRKAWPQAELIDCGEGILLPPLVNAHTHLELSRFPTWEASRAELPVEEGFVGWVERLIEIKRHQDEAELLRSVHEGLELALRCGTGALADILSQPRLLRAYQGSPLYGRVYHEVLGVEPAFVEPRLQAVEALLTTNPGRFAHGLSPHAPYTLSREMLERVLNFAELHDLPVSIHLAESEAEREFFEAGAGPIVERLYPFVGWKDRHPRALRRSPVAYLREMGGLGPATLAVHGVQVDAADAATLASAGTTVVLCPRSNDRLGVGLPPVDLYLRAGVRLALGTDSLASNASLSLWDELAFVRRVFGSRVAPGESLAWATCNGAEALGLSAEMGQLTPGYGAHFQVVELPERPSLGGLEEALCSAGGELRVRRLVLAGEEVLPEC